jgi:hypothetical protein
MQRRSLLTAIDTYCRKYSGSQAPSNTKHFDGQSGNLCSQDGGTYYCANNADLTLNAEDFTLQATAVDACTAPKLDEGQCREALAEIAFYCETFKFG